MSVGKFIYYYGACNTDGEYIKDTAYLYDEDNQHVCSLYNVTFNTIQRSLNIGPMPCTELSSDNALTDCSDMPAVSIDALCVFGVRGSQRDMLWTIECHSTMFCHASEFNSM